MAKIKICQIEDLDTAKLMVWMGADYLGFHIINENHLDRVSKFSQIINILQKSLAFYNSVIVTKLLDINLLHEIMNKTGAEHLQLHFGQNQRLAKQLSDSKNRNYKIISYTSLDAEKVDFADYVDFLIVDHESGGTGIELDEKKLLSFFKLHRGKSIFLAGGITPYNIKQKDVKFAPFAFDVQSSLEISKGRKNYGAVRAIMQNLKGNLRRTVSIQSSIVSLSLTDISEFRDQKKITEAISESDLVHVDHSNGHFSHKFVRDSLKIVEKLNFDFPNKIYDVHIFGRGDFLLKSLMRYFKANKKLRVVFVHCESLESGIFHEIERLYEFSQAYGVHIGLALQAGIKISNNNLLKLQIKLENEISELSVVGLSPKKSLKKYKDIVLPTVRLLSNTIKLTNRKTFLAIDRDVTLEKVKCLEGLEVSRVIVGKAILHSPQPKDAIGFFRSALVKV